MARRTKPTRSAKGGTSAKSPAPRRPASGGRRREPDDDSAAQNGSRPLWSGNIRLALVSVPVKIYPATRSGARISFHQVHEPSGKRIRYQKVAPGIGPVDTDDIVKGFELESGRYVLLEADELDALKLEAKKTLDLIQFVSQGEIDPIWFDRPYYVVADGDLAEEAYGVLRDALRASKQIGLGQFVMRGRAYVAALKPCGRGLLLETLRFADEVRESAPFFADIDADKPDQELLGLAQELIKRKTAPFEPKRFHDEYTAAVRELIAAKRKHQKPLHIDEDEEKASGGGAQIIDLVEALKRSVSRSKGDEPPTRIAPRRRKAG